MLEKAGAVLFQLLTAGIFVHVACQPDEHRQLSVLMVTIPLAGHLSVPVSLGEELVRRGHRVTIFVATPEGYDPLREQVEKAGIQYRSSPIAMTSSEFVQLQEHHVNNTQGPMGALKVRMEMVTFIQQLLQVTYSALNESAGGRWDIVTSDEVTLSVVSCLSRKWGIPLMVLSSNLQFTPPHQPPWPFPTVMSNKLTDDLDFRGRFFVAIQVVLTKLMITALAYASAATLEHCPATASEIVSMSGVKVPYIVPSVIGFEYPRPLSPLTTYTGPILSLRNDPLPGYIQAWLDGRSEGGSPVVYISMGSAAILTPQAARAIVGGLNAAGYCAVWSLRKANRNVLEGLDLGDDKVLLLDWAPQLAILRHRVVRVAILHGGMNGVQEALHSGVPIIALPVFGDQQANADRLVHHGLGIRLDADLVTVEQIAESLRAIEKGEYHSRISKLQRIFRHAGGVTKAADLVELYADVGYDHLIPAYARYEWTWIQYYNVDVYLLLLAVAGLVVIVGVRLCRCCFVRCCRCMLTRKSKVE